MATVDQPKPSEPKSTQPEQQPLHPGQTQTSRSADASPQRPNIQTPDSQQDKFGTRRER